MHKLLQCLMLVALMPALAACQDSGDNGAQSAAAVELSDGARFDQEMRKNGCALLTPQQVSTAFNVPADALKQMKILGCRYSWSDDEETLEAGISMIRAHKSEKSAASWFGNATASKTAEEMQAEMEKVAERLQRSKELDTDVKQSAASGILASVGSRAINFDDVAGAGDEARMNDEGTVFVRIDNLTFMVSAYKGPKAPAMDMTGVELAKLAAAAKEHSEQWAVQSAPQRRQDGVKLARVIVAGME